MDQLFFRKIFEESLDSIISLLSIPSVYDEGSINAEMPYGQYVHKAFEYMKDIAEKDGFDIRAYDGHALSFSCGKGEERIDIVSHLDVVAADEEDFNIRVKDKRIYGRGTTDMKVPMYMTYLALKLLKEKYPEMAKEIRIVLGGDEERTMNDMRHYIEKAGYPTFAFTPDGHFPIGIGEKGALMWTLTSSYSGIIESLRGGTQCNIISPIGECVINDTKKLEQIKNCIKKYQIDADAQIKENKIQISVRGKAAHASLPAEGRNATIDLLRVIAEVYQDELCNNLYNCFSDSYGRGFDSFVDTDNMKCLSVNLGVLKIEDNKVYAMIDCRYPYGQDSEVLTQRLKDKVMTDVSLDYDDEPTMCDENDPYVKILLETYRENTGDYSRPYVSGGVSYSKVFKHCVSYGPVLSNEEQVAHQKGEYISIDKCVMMLKIYYEAIEKVIKL